MQAVRSWDGVRCRRQQLEGCFRLLWCELRGARVRASRWWECAAGNGSRFCEGLLGAGGSLDPEEDLGAKLFSHLLADLTR